MSKVSVIIPSFNCAQYIIEAIESVLAQTYKNIEIIVIDDGSKDETKNILQPYILNHKIHYFYQDNKGLSSARNSGLRLAKGEYIKFLDSDDFLYPEQIEKQVDHIKSEENSISITDFSVLKATGELKTMKIYLVKKEHQLASFIESNRGVVHAFLVPKHLIENVGGFDETLKSCEDLDLWIRILKQGGYIKYLPYVGCCYRILNTSMSANTENMFLQKCKVYEKFNNSLINEKTLPTSLTNSILIINIELINECLVRKLPLNNLLDKTLLITTRIFDSNKKGILKLFYKIVGFENYFRLKYYIKKLLQKKYSFNLIHQQYQWKH